MMHRCSSCFEQYDEMYNMCPYCGYVEGEGAAEAFALDPGTEVAGRYIIGEMVGLGGFGITYKAWDRTFEAVVAIKEYYPSGLVNRLPGNTDLILVATKRAYEFSYGKDRFLEEARNTAKFSTHPNIVNVYDYFEENNTAYIVMEFLKGKTLNQMLQQNHAALSYQYCIDVAVDVCCALDAIHREHILHRDISPDNIMVCDDGTVKLFDFGAARFSAGVENRVTVVVKPGFAPPEQYDKVNRQDARTDIYALGATLYYAMTGKKPEESTNRKIDDTLEEPAALVPEIPANISTIVMRAMAVEQQYRFASAREFQDALVSEKAIRSVKTEKRRRQRRRLVSICATLLVVLGAAGGFFYVLEQQRRAATLPDAALTVWYVQGADLEMTEAKRAALEATAETFTDEYSNVTVTVTGVPQEEYLDRLEQARADGTAPQIFESTQLDPAQITGAVSLAPQLAELTTERFFCARETGERQYPTGIVIPIIYTNTTILPQPVGESLEDFLQSCQMAQTRLVVSPEAQELYQPAWGNALVPYVSDVAVEQFVARDAAVLLGDSTDYFSIQEAVPGEYALRAPAWLKATYRYGTLWSVETENKGEQRAATALVAYFNTNLAQDHFHIQEHSGCLPMPHDMLDQFGEVYGELSVAGEYLSRPYGE